MRRQDPQLQVRVTGISRRRELESSATCHGRGLPDVARTQLRKCLLLAGTLVALGGCPSATDQKPAGATSVGKGKAPSASEEAGTGTPPAAGRTTDGLHKTCKATTECGTGQICVTNTNLAHEISGSTCELPCDYTKRKPAGCPAGYDCYGLDHGPQSDLGGVCFLKEPPLFP